MKEETIKILTTTILSLLDSKMENLSWQLSTSTVATLKTTTLLLDFLNTLVLLFWLMIGILIKLMKNANKFLNNVSLYFTLEPVKPSIESNLHSSERMELLFMLQKRLNRNGTSENSEKERMKNSGNDGLIFIQRIFLHIFFYSIKIILFHFKR